MAAFKLDSEICAHSVVRYKGRCKDRYKDRYKYTTLKEVSKSKDTVGRSRVHLCWT
jgi:hypothetical protein